MGSKCFYIIVLLLIHGHLLAQITLLNASFEGVPSDAVVPKGWEACGIYSTPDILPGSWDVDQAAVDGETFLGLTTRSDKTWEFIGQMLKMPLKKNQCYSFNVSLARSPTYADFNLPVKLRIWGGHELCESRQMLAQSEAITHEDWRNYEFIMVPKSDIRFVIIEAYYTTGPLLAYDGNILVDHCSSFEACDRVFVENDDFSSN